MAIAATQPAMQETCANQSARLEDYLNDKVQTVADFEALDSLLANVQNQQQLLHRQLKEAQDDLEQADGAQQRANASLKRKADVFKSHQANIDRKLLTVTRPETSDNAAGQFETAMEQLRRLDLANGYLEMLEEVDRLSTQAVDQVEDKPDDALAAFVRLHSFASGLEPLHSEAEGAAPHLLDFVSRQVDVVRVKMLEPLEKRLEKVLTKILWPKPNVKMPEGVQVDFSDACAKLLRLQKPALLMSPETAREVDATGNKSATVLLPLQVMVKPLAVRFKFHFSGNKITNRLDKPEYFLSHIQDLLSTYAPMMNDHLQPVLLQAFHGTDLTYNLNYIDASSAFVAALLPMVREKVFALVSQVSGDPRLLSHLMHEIMNFDQALQDDWRYGLPSSRSSTNTWRGLAWEVLAEQKCFDRWLEVEKDFALARYQSIIDDQDSITLDFDGPESTATKPTKAAVRVNDLLETITDRYKRLSSFNQKMRFLIDVQISIFDRFHARLQQSLEALTRTSSAENLSLLKPLEGLDRLCRVFGSAEFLEKAMRDWSDDVFFVELWNELQTRAKFGGLDQPRVNDIAARTSNTLTANDLDTGATGALFDETAAAYARLRVKAEEILLESLSITFRTTMRPYAREGQWNFTLTRARSDSSPETPASDALPTTSSESLNPVISALNEQLGSLAKALGKLPLRRVGRHVAAALDDYFVEHVVLGNSFSEQGAAQLRVDVEIVAATLTSHIGSAAGTRGMRRAMEAASVLGLHDDFAGANTDGSGAAEGELYLADVERRLFSDEESAREVLEELGCERLTVAEARKVVSRRVEVER